MEDINSRLRELYSGSAFYDFKEYATTKRELTHPYLLRVPDGYAECRKRVMIVGQETFGWHDDKPDITVEGLMEEYHSFVNGHRGRERPMWHRYNKWREEANARGAELVANNIAKVGYKRGTGYDEGACERLARIFREELEICRPDVIVFVTGPRYDAMVTSTMQCKMQALEGFHYRQFAKLDYKGAPAWRTCHPGYIRRHNKEFAPILKEINHIITE